MDGVFFLISCQIRPAAVVALRFGLEVDWDWAGATAWFELRRHILPSIPRNAAGRGALHFRGGWLGWTGSPGPGRSRGPAIRAALDLGWSRRKSCFLRRYKVVVVIDDAGDATHAQRSAVRPKAILQG